eukprot:jgi/Botrbrau1/2947/Bobra.0026s0018.1
MGDSSSSDNPATPIARAMQAPWHSRDSKQAAWTGTTVQCLSKPNLTLSCSSIRTPEIMHSTHRYFCKPSAVLLDNCGTSSSVNTSNCWPDNHGNNAL